MQPQIDASNPNANRDLILQNLTVAIGTLTKMLAAVLPTVQGQSPSASGGGGALPANPAGFFIVTNPSSGQPVKVPFYGM